MTTFSFFNSAVLLLVLLVCVSLVNGQTRTPSPSSSGAGTNAASSGDVCTTIGRLSDELDALVYESEGFGAPLAAEQVDWEEVSSYLASNFTWYDYSALSSQGNYSDYRAYWEALNAATAQWQLKNVSVEEWTSCDPVARREISQWTETYARADDPTRSEVSTSIYVIEYDNQLKATRQEYWTSGNLANLRSA